MKLKDIAKDCGVHYQKAARFARAMMAERVEEMVWGHDFDKATAATLKERILAKASPKEVLIRSTATQRAAWADVWRKALIEAEPPRWDRAAVVLACIARSGDAEWLQAPLGTARVGDRVLLVALVAGVDGKGLGDAGDEFSGFTGWLYENGVRAETAH
jgi:hypothetical protein